jgi:hypothetical protein
MVLNWHRWRLPPWSLGITKIQVLHFPLLAPSGHTINLYYLITPIKPRKLIRCPSFHSWISIGLLRFVHVAPSVVPRSSLPHHVPIPHRPKWASSHAALPSPLHYSLPSAKPRHPSAHVPLLTPTLHPSPAQTEISVRRVYPARLATPLLLIAVRPPRSRHH